jgi:hypothetical protein
LSTDSATERERPLEPMPSHTFMRCRSSWLIWNLDFFSLQWM